MQTIDRLASQTHQRAGADVAGDRRYGLPLLQQADAALAKNFGVHYKIVPLVRLNEDAA
ncbi:hypothetical protein [Methylomonas sp. CM2]|uniref:hypothetical protein n=1 Tax=Methylomonas sp. CM2 TaxID=3417647 RepID=UPI003CF9F58C